VLSSERQFSATKAVSDRPSEPEPDSGERSSQAALSADRHSECNERSSLGPFIVPGEAGEREQRRTDIADILEFAYTMHMIMTEAEKKGAEREALLRQELDRIVEILKKEYQPEEIILFGSMAQGDIHAWSDIDLLIIKETDQRPIDRCTEVCRIVKPVVGLDLFVYTPSEYQMLLTENLTFVRNIARTGTVLYAQGN
jgi:uncharacterized protein